MAIFTGSGVAIVTPFNQDDTVNYTKLRQLINWQIENGTDSIVICGTTGESSTLDDHEHLECIRVAVEETNKRVPVIAGTGSNDTHHGIKLSQAAQRLGADGLLQVSPYYNKTTQKGLIAHFGAIANSVSIPIMLYNVPSRTGMNIAPKTVAELIKIDNIVAMKEASGDITQICELMSLTHGDLDLYSGNDDHIIPLLSVGGIGVVSVVANILPKETHDIVALYLNGQHKEALALQLGLNNLIKNLFIETNPIPIKEALNMMGHNVGHCRLPLCEMEPSNVAILKKALIDYSIEVI